MDFDSMKLPTIDPDSILPDRNHIIQIKFCRTLSRYRRRVGLPRECSELLGPLSASCWMASMQRHSIPPHRVPADTANREELKKRIGIAMKLTTIDPLAGAGTRGGDRAKADVGRLSRH